ncbi:hypothetical protein B0H21DRAFT_825433 [Amylocystis lapponica]|nr:hypothetical protein B0H21DRAFT_825433 [Amylocystis lapponica]
MRSLLSHVLVLAVLPLALADHSPRVLHRLYDPSQPPAPFRPRAFLHVSSSGPGSSVSIAPAETFSADLLEFLSAAEDSPSALYQLALERPTDTDPSHWDISSVKACHLPQSTSESVTVHLAADGTPFSLDYFIGPIPRDGACPSRRRAKASGSLSSAAAFTGFANTTVTLAEPRLPPLPLLRTPPPLTPEGQPVQTVPEKSFIQKYWMYILAVLLVLVVSPGGGEEGGGSGGNGGGGR